MKVIFQTNIDAYNEKHPFPTQISEVPRKGDFVRVRKVFIPYYEDLKLPTQLEVVRVTWEERHVWDAVTETIAVCELWYNDTERKLAELAGAKTL